MTKAKISAFILILTLVLINVSVKVPALQEAKLTVATISSNADSEMDIAISISENPGIATFRLQLSFDNSKLEPVSITKGSILPGSLTSNIGQGGDLSVLHFVTAYWVNPSNITDSGVLYTVKFKVKSNVSGNIPLTLSYSSGDISNQGFTDINPIVVHGGINVGVLEKVSAPAANPSGGVLMNGSTVTLSTATSGASIYYTTNGTIPTTGDLLYLSPIAIIKATTIKAIAVKDGMLNSDIATFGYSVVPLNSPVLTVSSVLGNIGDEVDVPIYISNNPGIATFNLKILFEKEKLLPVSITKGASLTASSITSNIQQGGDLSALNYVTAYWVNSSNFTSNGEIIKVRFKIKEGISGNMPISVTYSPGDIINQAFTDINPATVTGGITVIPSENKTEIMQSTLAKSGDTVRGNIKINVTSRINIPNAKILVALYDNNSGRLVGLAMRSASFGVGTTPIELTDVSFDGASSSLFTVKVFTWAHFQNLQPINTSVTAQLQ